MESYLTDDQSPVSTICSPSLMPKFSTSRIVTFKKPIKGDYPVLIVDRIKVSPIFDRMFIYQLKDFRGCVYNDGVWIPESKLAPTEIQTSPQPPPPQLERQYIQPPPPPPDNAMKQFITVKSAPRPFPCLLRPLCTLTFGSKNEWKRHTSIQHLCLGFYRCQLESCEASEVSPTTSSSKEPKSRYNDFNRKDLFTQHIRRKHMPKKFRKSGGGATDVAQRDWENTNLPDIHKNMWIEVRQPPKFMRCGCGRAYEGYEAWQERMECLGRHLKNSVSGKYEEKLDLETSAWLVGKGMDPEMARWMESEGLLIRCADNEPDSFEGFRFPKDTDNFQNSNNAQM